MRRSTWSPRSSAARSTRIRVRPRDTRRQPRDSASSSEDRSTEAAAGRAGGGSWTSRSCTSATRSWCRPCRMAARARTDAARHPLLHAQPRLGLRSALPIDAQGRSRAQASHLRARRRPPPLVGRSGGTHPRDLRTRRRAMAADRDRRRRRPGEHRAVRGDHIQPGRVVGLRLSANFGEAPPDEQRNPGYLGPCTIPRYVTDPSKGPDPVRRGRRREHGTVGRLIAPARALAVRLHPRRPHLCRGGDWRRSAAARESDRPA